MTAPPRLPSDPALQGDGPSRAFGVVTPFADAGPRDEIADVERGLVGDIRIWDKAFRADGRLAQHWQGVIRRVFTDSVSRGTDGPGPCRHTRHLLLGWQGIYVDGARALALLEERSNCVAPERVFRGRLEHLQYALRRVDGRWLLEAWISRDKPLY